MQSECLAEQPFDSIAANGGANAAGDANPQPRMAEIVWQGIGGERALGLFDFTVEYGGENQSAAQTVSLGKFVARSLHGGSSMHRLTGQPALGVQCGLASHAGGGDGLFIDRIGNIAGGEDALDAGQ